MHEPRLKRGLAIGYAISPTGADHCHSLHDTGVAHTPEPETISPLGILETVRLEDFGPAKVRLSLYHTIMRLAGNCLVLCDFVPWTYDHIVQMMRAGTGWNVSLFELFKAGERALTMTRVYNIREGFGVDDDWLAPRSFQPPGNGPIKAGVDPDDLKRARHLFYGMMGWDEYTGVPTLAKLYELDIGWVQDHLACEE